MMGMSASTRVVVDAFRSNLITDRLSAGRFGTLLGKGVDSRPIHQMQRSTEHTYRALTYPKRIQCSCGS